MKPTLAVTLLLALAAVAGAVFYQAAARERDYRALVRRGDAALREGETFIAIEAYSGAIALRSDSMLAHLRRGETYQQRGDLESASRDFKTAAELDPSATRPLEAFGDVQYRRGRFKRAAEVFENRLRLDNESPPVAYKLAVAVYRDGNIDGARAAVADTLRLTDRLPEAHYLLGLCLRDRRQLEEAAAAFERAAAMSPGFIPAREELADLYSVLGRPADELEQLQIIAGLDRAHPERHVALGLAQARAGYSELAVLTLGNALERAPDQPLIYAALGRVWLDRATAAANDPVFLSKALEALEPAASASGATSDALTLYGRALMIDNRLEAAERVLREATRRYPVDPHALPALAAAAERLDHIEVARDALVDYDALISDESALATRAATIARMSLRLNDLAAAAVWFERAASARPNDVRLLAALADVQLRLGDLPRAQATIASGLEQDPANAELLALDRRIR